MAVFTFGRLRAGTVKAVAPAREPVAKRLAIAMARDCWIEGEAETDILTASNCSSPDKMTQLTHALSHRDPSALWRELLTLRLGRR